ncbi:MAG TPA: YihY/virulence factor BrkB family protein [Thermoanaerobaculia bacterium]|nr:YihY/virulence factor BrkB family protein [Thermoanaerobaculia bacterium]
MSRRSTSAFALLGAAWKEFQEDEAPQVAAALAYYTVFSVAPLLLVLIAVGGMVLGEEAARGEIVRAARDFIGTAGAEAVQDMVRNSRDPDSGRLAIGLGILGLLIGASTASMHLKQSLNVIWELPRRKIEGVRGMVRSRILSLAIVLTIGFLLISSMAVSAIIAAVGKHLAERLRGGELLWQVCDVLLSIVVITLLFAMLFKFLPDVRIEWRDVWTGAFFTALLFVIGKVALGIWIGRASFGSTFGAAASLLVLLVWIYYSSVILFFGAEFTQVHARAFGRAPAAWKETLPAAAGHPPAEGDRAGRGVPFLAGGLLGCGLGVLGVVGGVLAASLRLIRRMLRLG